MKLYFDSNLIINNSPQDGYKVVYNPTSHSTIKLNDTAEVLLKKIIQQGSGYEFNTKNFIKEDEDALNAIKFIDKLVECKIIFYSNEEKENNSMSKRIDKVSERKTNKLQLQMAYIHITQKCNFNCDYCYNKKNLNRGTELTTDQWFTIIDRLCESGIKYFILTGGEPYLRKDLLSISKYIKEKNKILHILSNGSLIGPENYTVLQYVDEIIISLDSIDKHVNETNRSNSKHYNVVNNISNIPKKYMNKISIRCVITKNNINDLQKMKQFVKNNLGYKFLPTMFLPNNKSDIENIPDVTDELLDSLSESIPFPKNMIINCGGCFKEVGIDSNGDVYPCQNLIIDKFKITNMFNENWLEILKDSKVTKTFMDMDIRNRSICGDCEYIYLCGGACRAVTYKVYGTLDGHPDFLCNQFKMLSDNKIKSFAFKDVCK